MDAKQRSDLIETALREALKGLEDTDDDDIIVEWALVAYVTNPTEEKGSGYPVFYSNGNMPSHNAHGLFLRGLMMVD